jgi:mannose-6-phosphate isomerase-like protein (cupin superfamily)
MNVLRRTSAPRYQRDNITSYLLASAATAPSQRLTVSLVEMEPGGVQHLHAHEHEPEQCYYILEGSGLMSVAGEERPVGAGDCVFIPSLAEHGLKNTSGTTLRYLSAASPSFTAEECRKYWPMKSIEEEKAS